MTIPDEIRRSIKKALWERLDDLSWLSMSDSDHSAHYERWTRDPDIGGRLGHFMDPRAVRVYIKDTLVKDYARERLLESSQRVLQLLGLASDVHVTKRFIKPHGLVIESQRVVCWGKSRDWKHLLMAAFERQRAVDASLASAVVILETGKTTDIVSRDLISDAACRLNINPLRWWE